VTLVSIESPGRLFFILFDFAIRPSDWGVRLELLLMTLIDLAKEFSS
jgi:hypothetical protein